MEIYFILKDEPKMVFAHFTMQDNNPFKIGDIITLSIIGTSGDYLYRKTIERLNLSPQGNPLADIKIISERKVFNYSHSIKPRISIEYICELVKT